MGKIVKNILAYGFGHAVVDAICAATIFNFLFLKIPGTTFLNLIVLYGVLAFGLQPIIGLLSDKIKSPRNFSIVGLVLAAAGTLLTFNPYLSVALLGLGNAVYHIGAGTVGLNLTPRKASAPGIFVAPGAIGLFIGTLIGKFGYFVYWYFLVLALIACFAILSVRLPKINYKISSGKIRYFELILVLLSFSILIRSFIGLVLVFPWKASIPLAIILTLCVFLGKALGGILADKFGWRKVALISLLISAPLLAFYNLNPVMAILGVFLFNMTMPITLVAISNLLPGRPGFAFGLTCLALIFGECLAFLGLSNFLNNILILLIIIASAIALYFGLRLGKKIFY